MSLVFYYSPRSSATRAHWALEELGIPYEAVKLDLPRGDAKKPEFLRVNPNGKIPALVEDGVPMFESLAILVYLGEKFGIDKGLWPRGGTPEQMTALSWSIWGLCTFEGAVHTFVHNTLERFPAALRNPAQAEAAKVDIHECLRILDAHLAGKENILGSAFSLADVTVVSSVLFLHAEAKLGTEAYPNVNGWVERTMKRPAVRVL